MAETQDGQCGDSLVPFLAYSHSWGILGSRDDVRLSSSSHTVKASCARPAWISAAAASKNTSGMQGPSGDRGGKNWGGRRMQCLEETLATIPNLFTMLWYHTETTHCLLPWTPWSENLPSLAFQLGQTEEQKKKEKTVLLLYSRVRLQSSHPIVENLEDIPTFGSESSSNTASRSK